MPMMMELEICFHFFGGTTIDQLRHSKRKKKHMDDRREHWEAKLNTKAQSEIPKIGHL